MYVPGWGGIVGEVQQHPPPGWAAAAGGEAA